MQARTVVALAAVLVGTACEVPVATKSNPLVEIVSVAVQPKTATLLIGDSLQLSASVALSDGHAQSSVTWTSSSTNLATVSPAGVVRARSIGSLFVHAASGTKHDSAAVAVVAPSPAPVASVSVTPASASLTVGGTLQLTATLKDATGNPLAGRVVTWSSNNPSVITVSGSGLLAAVAAGSTTIAATSEGVSGTTSITIAPALSAPGSVTDLAVATVSDTSVTLSFTEVDDGSGHAAGYDIRYVAGTSLSWSAAVPSVSRGTCATPVAGTTIGAKRSCTVLGLATATTYSFELVAYRGTLGTGAVFGGLSNVTSGTTSGATPPPPPPPGAGVTYYRTNFSDGTLGPLGFYSYAGSGTWAASTDYVDAGSARSIKFTIPGTNSDDAAALQAWFGHGGLAGTPLDPTLDQDLFQEVRFVIAPGAARAIGGNTCAGNPTSQIKVHKSVYGQVGGNINGWVMTDFAPCGGVGAMATEPELYGQPTAYSDMRIWPTPLPYAEGQVYDIVYRYHRYSASGVGTVAVWVNGVKIMDSQRRGYIGTTNGSAGGLVLWDGATYLQSPFGAYSVYVLFTQATNYPIGPATASP
jgi:hypothetical protein